MISVAGSGEEPGATAVEMAGVLVLMPVVETPQFESTKL